VIIYILRLLFSIEEQKHRDLVQSMAYGNNSMLIKSLYKSKFMDLFFCIASSWNEILSDIPRGDANHIFNCTLHILECVFDLSILKDLAHYTVSKSISCLTESSLDQDLMQKPCKRPIRHGRFSGAVSVQLSVGSIFQTSCIIF